MWHLLSDVSSYSDVETFARAHLQNTTGGLVLPRICQRPGSRVTDQPGTQKIRKGLTSRDNSQNRSTYKNMLHLTAYVQIL